MYDSRNPKSAVRSPQYDEPTLDPVELERRLIAEDNAAAIGEKGGRRWPVLSALALAVSLLSVAAYIVAWANTVQNTGGPEGYVRTTGFVSTFTAAQIIYRGNGPLLYDPAVQYATQQGLRASNTGVNPKIIPYDAPPFEALLVAPLASLPLWVVFAFWTLAIGGFSIGMAVGFLDGALPVPRRLGWVLSLAVCSYFPVVRSLMLGEDVAFVLMGLCGLYMALKGGHELWAAVALLLLTLKPQVLPAFILLLLLQRHWKTLASFAALLAALSAVTAAGVGVGWPLSYLQFLTGPMGWGANGAANPASQHNLRGLVSLVFSGGAYVLATPLFVLLSLAALALIVWAWRRSRAANTSGEDIRNDSEAGEDYQPRTDLLWALTAIAAVLTAVQLDPQDLTLLVFPAWIIGAYAAHAVWGRGLSALWLVLLWAGYVLSPFTLYSTNSALSVVPIVLLMLLAVGLLAWLLSDKDILDMVPDEVY